jgi:predicted secreted Zn-dependent protease
VNGNPDYTLLDDPALLAARAEVRAQLDEVTTRYKQLTDEFDRRAGTAWTRVS